MKNIVEGAREVVREQEGFFLNTLVGNPSLYRISNSSMAEALVDAFAEARPQAFVEAVGRFLCENVEVA